MVMRRLMCVVFIILQTGVTANAAIEVKQDGIVYNCSTNKNGVNIATVKDYEYAQKCPNDTLVFPYEVYYVNSNGDKITYYLKEVCLHSETSTGKKASSLASNIVISEGTTSIKSGVWMPLKSVTLPSTCSTLPPNATVTRYYFPNGSRYFALDNNLLYTADMSRLLFNNGFKDTTYTVPASVTQLDFIPSSAKHLYFEEGSKLATIKDLSNFNGTDFTVPKNWTAFPSNWGTKIKNIYFEDDTIILGCRSIDGIIYDKDTTKLVRIPSGRRGNIYLPNKLTTLCNGISSVYDTVFIGDNVTAKGFGKQWDYVGEAIPFYKVSESNPYLCSDDIGAIYSKDKKTIYRFPTSNLKKISTYTVPEHVKSIANGAFCSASIGTLIIDHACTIGSYSFTYSGVKKLIIGNGVTSLGDGAFRYCTSLADVTFGDDLKVIGMECFDGDNGLKEINLNKVTELKSKAFMRCAYLTSVQMPNMKKIGGEAFKDDTRLTFVDLSNVTSLGQQAFCNSGLRKVGLGNISYLGSGVFYHANNLTTVVIGSNVNSLPTDLFYGCDKFHTLAFNEGLDSLANNALSGVRCDSIFTIVFPSSLVYLGDQNFDNFNNLKDVWINSAANLGSAVSTGRPNTNFHYSYKNRNKKDIDAVSESATEESNWSYSETLQNKGYNKKDKLYYGTFYLDRSYIVPKGVTMYTVNGATYSTYDAADGTDIFSLNLVKYAAGSTVPAGTAVIATTSDNLELQFDIATGSAAKAEAEEVNNTAMTITDIYLGGFMKDSLIEQQSGYRYYKLTTADDDPGDYSTLGFYGDANTDSCGAFVSKAQKAFLAVQYTNYLQAQKQAATGVNGAKFMFNINNATDAADVEDNNTTAITDLITDKTPTFKGMYNLNGQQVQGNYKGIIITNGKKVIK
jgi:hypothetical protein